MRAMALILGLLLGLSACGDDSDEGFDGGLRDAGDGGSRPVLPGVDGGDGGDVLRGDGEEGSGCDRDSDCMEGLGCFDNIFTTGVCGRPCSSNAECEPERCLTYTTSDDDAHCIDTVTEQFELCGVGDTSVCSDTLGLECLYLPQLPVGICVLYCDLGADGEGDGGTDDAGVPGCGAGQACIDGVAVDSTGASVGVCGYWAERGEECGITQGRFCREVNDICAPEDPTDSDSDLRCYPDCTGAGASCPDGTTCTDYRGQFAYCL